MSLTQDEIKELKELAPQIVSLYSARDTIFKTIEDIYFMENPEKPKGLDVDEKDIKTTISPAGRNDVTGLKRILDTGDLQFKVKDKGSDAEASDKIEAALKTIFRVSGELRQGAIDKDENLSAILYGMNSLSAELIDDVIQARTTDAYGNDKEGVNKFVIRQLEELKKRTPFLVKSVNAGQSYPEWGEYGMVGHVQKYTLRGNKIKERWGCNDKELKPTESYTVWDFYHYDKRLTWAEGIDEELFAGVWIDSAAEVPILPIFVRYGGGSSLFHEPEKQLHPFLYAKAKGEWDKRENLFWTYVFTAIFNQGLPGPVFFKDPEDTSETIVKMDGGIRVIRGKGKLENMNIIDSDVMQMFGLMEKVNGQSTIQPEAFGANNADTFSSYVMSMNASRLPSEDPKEGVAKVYRDAGLYILKRMKAESIEFMDVTPNDIPDDVDLEVTLEPNLTQDDLRNAQIATNLKNANTKISDEWINTNIIKIADTEAMKDQIAIEQAEAAMWQAFFSNPQTMQGVMQAAFKQWMQPSPAQTPPTNPADAMSGMVPPDEMPTQPEGAESMPQTDAMVPPGREAIMRDYADLMLEAQANVQRRMGLLMKKLLEPQMKQMAAQMWAQMDDGMKERYKQERPEEYAQLLKLLGE